MELAGLEKGARISMSGERVGTVIEVFPTAGYATNDDGRKIKRKPRVVVALDSKPTMAVKVAASMVVGRASV